MSGSFPLQRGATQANISPYIRQTSAMEKNLTHDKVEAMNWSVQKFLLFILLLFFWYKTEMTAANDCIKYN